MSIAYWFVDTWEAYVSWGNTYQVYGQTSIYTPTANDTETTWEDYFDCSNFTTWTYVCCYVAQIENTWSTSTSATIRVELQAYISWSWETRHVAFANTVTIAAWATRPIRTSTKFTSWYVDTDATVYRYRVLAIDSDWSLGWLNSSFTVTLPQWSIDCNYWVWKGLEYDWSLIATYYEKDIDQDAPSTTAPHRFEPYNSVNSFDLSNCGVWSWVWCFAIYRENSYPSSKSLSSTTLTLQAYIGWSWTTRKTKTLSWSISSWWYRWWYFDFSVLPWEIRTDATNYRVTWNRTVGSDTWTITKSFTISNLNIDSTAHTPWYLWIDWLHLCYTDGYWYVHEIKTDNSHTPTSVWTDKKWYMWLETNDNSRIYYVTQSWYVYRTPAARAWYWWNTNVWSDKAWYMWVSSWTSASSWRYCLCFIAPNWNKMRIINGDN